MISKNNSEIDDAWHRSIAVQSNNLAWQLVEKVELGASETLQLVTAAAVARFHWHAIGTPSNKAHADLLLSFGMSRANNSGMALLVAESAYSYFQQDTCADWEKALGHAALAFAHHCNDDLDLHGDHYSEAKRIGSSLPEEERSMFLATFDIVPRPAQA